ncbi:hypothetical protein V8J88_02465 [Massilia sp. W12]|uniref:hypothetical protein n=1 Tax=Massilia sp. W12 TaxID=3126507 RepID=UPI0030CDCCFB
MLFLALEDEILACRQALAAAQGLPALLRQIELAWHLRQRNCSEAQSLAHQARAGLRECGEATQPCAHARLLLVEGELAVLHGDTAAGQAAAQAALAGFQALRDNDGVCDAYLLLAHLYRSIGRPLARQQVFADAAAHAQDPLRKRFAEINMAIADVYADVKAARQIWRLRMPASIDGLHPGLQSGVAFFWGILTEMEGQLPQAIVWWESAHQASLASGQLQRAIIAAGNQSYAYLHLQAYPEALAASSRALTLARPNAWPETLGAALMRNAEVLSGLQRHAQARPLLQEGLQLQSALKSSYNYAITLGAWCRNCLALNDAATALAAAQELEQSAKQLGAPQLLYDALCCQARAQLMLQELEAAHACILRATSAPQGRVLDQIAAWQLQAQTSLALLHDAGQALHCLEQALAISRQAGQSHAPPELLAALQQAYLQQGRTADAAQSAQLLAAALAARHDEVTQQRADALHAAHLLQRRQVSAL